MRETVVAMTPSGGLTTAVCAALGVSRSCVHRHRTRRDAPATVARRRPRPPRALDPQERQAVLDLLREPRFVDLIDGDTLEIAGDRYRLYGLDAPERGQLCRMPDGRNWPCGQEAGAALDRFIAARPVACTVRDRDIYGRWVAICRVDGADIGGWMVRGGWAVADHGVADGYTGAEGAARFLRFGLWAGAFDPPSEWRRAHP